MPPVNQTISDGVATSRRYLYAVRAVLHKEIVTGITCRAVGVLKYPSVVNWKDASGTIPQDRNTVGMTPISTTPVWTGTRPFSPPISRGSQKIEGPRRPIINQYVRNVDTLGASINIIPAKHRYPTPSWSNIPLEKNPLKKAPTSTRPV